MPIRPFLARVASEYDRTAKMSSEIQKFVRSATDVFADAVPPGYLVGGHGGQGTPTPTPWVGILDPDITDDPKHGLYIAYLFSADLVNVTLTIQQGMEEVSRRLGTTVARSVLRQDAEKIRASMAEAVPHELLEPFDLRFDYWRQKAYAAGSVAQTTYATAALPDESTLREDLERFFRVLGDAAHARATLLLSSPGALTAGGGQGQENPGEIDPLAHFKPKSSEDYIALLTTRSLVKTRRHEALIDRFGRHVASLGWIPSTEEHPLDLTLRRRGARTRVIVEAKVVRRGNSTQAVREAIGQLFTYQFHLVPENEMPETPLVALFSETIGDAYVALLDRLNIVAVWVDGSSWNASIRATGLDLI
ncbi:MrcB family domain-containing protein [Motilibacter aurantiacus]|uniref:MrcB family domain-containing protein n=1 Tax=Motilibacter aurantiacus TaxID=2714955 RepID=UPI001407AE72|nr:DUF3578 domain-containing protein [Motilibacter aurantiacus]NHC47134.1 DUF3578 domain-containing protein [Motilibacter aurantiacus]